jgi:hypothetical protein
MAGALKVYACVDWDVATETCAAHAYIDPPSVIPMLTVEQGNVLGFKLACVFISIRAVMYLKEAINDRIGS